MSIIFKPYGTIDVSTDPSMLKQAGDGRNVESGEMQRCKNLRINENGVAKTRHGSDVLNGTAMSDVPETIINMGGVRYSLGESIYRNETSIGSGYNGAQWSGIQYNSYNDTTENIFALNGTDRKRLEGSNVYEWGITAPTVAPTIIAGATTGLTGDYNVKYTYARKSGGTLLCESDPSPAGAAAVTLANESLSVTWTASADAQVTHVRVYRTLAGGAIYYHDQDIAVGTVTVDTDTADGSLGDEVETNHDRPPLGTVVIGPNFDGSCFILKDNLLYYCLPKQPEYWPTSYYVEVSTPQFPLKAGCFWNSQLYVASKREIYMVSGTGATTFFPVSQSALTGSPSQQGMLPVAGQGIFHVGRDGIYLFNSAGDKKVTLGRFDKIFQGQTSGNVPLVSTVDKSWLIEFEGRLYFGYRTTGNSHPRHILVMDLESKKTAYYDFGIEIPFVCTDDTNDRLLAIDSAGYAWTIDDKSKTDDDGTAINWDIMSKDFTLTTRAHFPRWVKYDIDASSADSCTGELFLNGSSHQSHTITGNRSTKRRLVATGNGERCSLRVSGTGAVSIHMVESE